MGTRFEDYTLDDANAFMGNNVDAVLLVDAESDTYRTLVQRGFLSTFIESSGKYTDLIQKLWFHLNKGQETITEDYQVFAPTFGKFSGKYSKRLKIVENDTPHSVQMTIYPESEKLYLLILVHL